MKLRPYQMEGHNKGYAAFKRGRRSLVYVLATGGGKTVLGIVSAIQMAKEMGGKVLWVAHRRELIKQALDTIRKVGYEAGAIAPRMRRDPEAMVQVASIQTLRAASDQMIPQDVCVMVWDECHHAVSNDWVHLAKEARKKRVFLIGLTATPERNDGRGLAPIFGTMIVVTSHKQLVRSGQLVPTEVLVPDVRLEDGVADTPVDLWEQHAKKTKTVVFCESVDHAVEVSREFSMRGYRCEFVEGEMSARERDGVIKRFTKGRTMVVTNCQILTEGFDLPPIRTVILARRVGSASLYLQMVGRGSRPFEDKYRNLVLDLTGNAYIYGIPEDDRKFSLQGKPIQLRDLDEVQNRKKCKTCGLVIFDDALRYCPKCGAPFVSEKTRRVHKKRLERMTAGQAADYEKAALDRLKDYARIRGKPDSWVRDRFVKKFGRLP